MTLLIVLVPALGAALLYAGRAGWRRLRLGRPGPAATSSWSVPRATSSPLEPSRPGPPPAGAVARALGRVEARELATSPWFGAGLGFCVLIVVLFGIWAGANSETWDQHVQLTPWLAHPLVGMLVLGGHRAATRAARDGTDELFDSCPTAPSTRTTGFLLSAIVPVTALVTFFAVLLGTNAVGSPYLHGPLGADSVADLLAAVALGAGGLALGVGLGQWVRAALAPIVAVGAVGFALTFLNGVGGHDWNPLVGLATAPTIEGSSPVFADRPVWWHLLWIVGLTTIVGVVALARHRRDLALAGAAATAVVVTLVAGIGVTRPLAPTSATRLATVIADPEAHQECAEIDGPVEVCVYPFHRELLDRASERIGPIAAVLPPALPPLTLRQAFDGDLGDLPPEVRRLLAESDLVRPLGEVPLGFGEELLDILDDPGFNVAFAAVGLPREPDAHLVPMVVAGEARGVVALWLAARGLDAEDTVRVSTASDPTSDDAFARGSLQAGPCRVPSVVWSAQDLAAARALITLPEADVARIVEDGWARWTDPRTDTDDLLAALGLPAVGPFDHVEPRPGEPC